MAHENPSGAPGAVCPVLRDNAEALLAYVERRMARDSALALERHAEGCAECRKLIESQRALWSALEAWEPEPVSADFNRRLYRAIEADEARPWWRKLGGGALGARWRVAVPAASCAALALVFLLGTPDEMEEKQAAAVEAVDVENLDRALDDLDLLWSLDEQLREESGAGSRI
jgi:anti-sigma factor RsiW